MDTRLAPTLAAVAATLVLVVQFAPWGTFETSMSTEGGDFGGPYPGFSFPGFDFDIKLTLFTWYAKLTVNGDTETDSWYDAEDGDGVGLVRTAIPMLLVSLLSLAAAAIVGFLRPGRMDAVLVSAGAALLVLGTVLYVAGVEDMMEDADHDWHVSFYIALLAAVVAVAATVVAWMRPPMPVRPPA